MIVSSSLCHDTQFKSYEFFFEDRSIFFTSFALLSILMMVEGLRRHPVEACDNRYNPAELLLNIRPQFLFVMGEKLVLAIHESLEVN